MVDDICNKITAVIKENVNGITDEKAEIISYGLNLVLYDLFVLTVLFALAAITGLFKYVLIAFLVFGSLRIFIGGAHARTRLTCTLSYLSTIFAIVLTGKCIPSLNFYPGIALCVINLAIIYIYAPGDTLEKPLLSKKIKKRQRLISLGLMVLLCLLSIGIWHLDSMEDNVILYNIVMLSTIPPVFQLTPIGYRLFKCHRSCEGA